MLKYVLVSIGFMSINIENIKSNMQLILPFLAELQQSILEKEPGKSN